MLLELSSEVKNLIANEPEIKEEKLEIGGYKVALKWFADDIATKLWKVKLVFSLSRIVTHDRVRHVGEHDYEDCWGVEGKPEIREQLNKELSILSKGSDTCKQCVRSKIDEGSWDPLLAAGYMSRESSEESALDEAGDETAPTYADEEDK
ncbi:hypothetical protein KXX32_001256 [Aspergillus fumigatus]|uniref:Uncharacterized protein n=1 Tax=Aspergillus fumigatus TaxID=746128 RepID=A0A9P8N8U7_ASPFM|nr:hypothetical protein KXX32_001256 [Aspergillus fumigatus]KAH1892596.1 hypothetical protein KXV57_003837 [Aspergillus fumigatus]KAH3038629.1 hypothetical protein KXW01_003661 [Aspergillus fumigatus]